VGSLGTLERVSVGLGAALLSASAAIWVDTQLLHPAQRRAEWRERAEGRLAAELCQLIGSQALPKKKASS
jgi:hypothetical protein